MKLLSILTLVITLVTFELCGQSSSQLYTPVTANSPLFSEDNELQLGGNLNNYGHNFKIAGQLKRKILIFSVQQNPGRAEFNPLNLRYFERSLGDDLGDSHLIRTKPSKMLYGELGVGYNFKHRTQKINLIAGIGRQFHNPNTRYFLQLDWGNESRRINAGVSLRANYTSVNNESLVILEPVIQGKVKIWNFRIVHQFGYALPLKVNEDYMKPVLTAGLEYVIGKSSHNRRIKKANRKKA